MEEEEEEEGEVGIMNDGQKRGKMILLTRKKLDAQAAKSDDYSKLEKRVRSKQPSNSWLVDEMMRMKEEEEEEEEEESSKQASKQQVGVRVNERIS
ncbi:hypothetical protein T4A_14452 [Trichinella pseudospiralis]|uniref:Uncharacterized protein n=1 Tax=Trichinella pseudospiralis TaxID=6337 RepID=A0A0V1EPZ4_TRIPS|nr:hypothetical protein T4A_14452 [Trichinella pseudospiralis]